MMTSRLQRLAALAILPSVLAGSGCKVLLPAHENSNKRAGERVSVNLLDYDAMAAYAPEYTAAFGTSLPAKPKVHQPAGQSDFGAMAAAAVIGFAVDYVKKELEKEATLYESQFYTTVAGDKFWIYTEDDSPEETAQIETRKSVRREELKTVGDTEQPRVTSEITEKTKEEILKNYGKYRQNYFGIEVQRHLGTNRVFHLVLGIGPSADQQFFRVAPLVFWTGKTKAKVLGDGFLTYVPPWNWPGKLLRTDGHHINSTVAVEMNGYWKDKTQEAKVSKIAALEFNFNGYDIASAKEWTASGKNGAGTQLPQPSAGWLLGVPISLTPEGRVVLPGSGYAGTFTVKAVVTEKDPSNAKESLEKAAQMAGEQKSRLIELVK